MVRLTSDNEIDGSSLDWACPTNPPSTTADGPRIKVPTCDNNTSEESFTIPEEEVILHSSYGDCSLIVVSAGQSIKTTQI